MKEWFKSKSLFGRSRPATNAEVDESTPPPAGGEEHLFALDHCNEAGLLSVVREWFVNAFREVQHLDYAVLFPWRLLFGKNLFQNKAVRLVFYLGLLPVVLLQVHTIFHLPLRYGVWVIELYFSLFWGAYFLSLFKASGDLRKRAFGYALFTSVAGVSILGLALQIPLVRQVYAGTSGNFISRIAACIFGIGLLEETTKALPLLIFAFRKQKIGSAREGMLLGAMSGLGFAAVEGAKYLTTGIQSVTKQAVLQSVEYVLKSFSIGIRQAFERSTPNPRQSIGASIEALARASNESISGAVLDQAMAGFFRLMSAPILHAAWAAILGWFIATAALRRGQTRWPVIVIGLLFVATLHGAYDAWSANPLGLIVAATSLAIFVGYLLIAITSPGAQTTGAQNLVEEIRDKPHHAQEHGNPGTHEQNT